MTKALFAVYIIFTLSCIAKKNTVLFEPIDNQKIISVHHLANRMKHCEDKVSFMRSVIRSDTAWIHIVDDTRSLSQIEITIADAEQYAYLEDVHLFYLDLACLSKLTLAKVLDILCKKEHSQHILDTIKTNNGKNDIIFEVSMSPMQGFNMIVKDGIIISSTWHKITKSH
jgi:hypothetical protein